jgi:hypothetical protein
MRSKQRRTTATVKNGENNFMRRIISLLILLVLGLSGCSEQAHRPYTPDGGVPEPTPSPEVSVTATPSVPPESPSPTPSANNPKSPEDTWIDGQIDTATYLSIYVGKYKTPVIIEDYGTYTFTIWDSGKINRLLYVNGIIMAPLNEFADRFGYSVMSDNMDIHRIIDKNGNDLSFTIASTTATHNNNEVVLEFYPFYKDKSIYIPLSCIAEVMGLYTGLSYSEYEQRFILWISESALLRDEEFIPGEKYEFVELREAYDEMGYYIAANVYRLRNAGHTYSGVRIGDSYDEAVALLGSPQYIKSQDSHIVLILYDFHPNLGDYSTRALHIYFEDGYVHEILLYLSVHP